MYQFQNYRRGQRVCFTCYDADRRTVWSLPNGTTAGELRKEIVSRLT